MLYCLLIIFLVRSENQVIFMLIVSLVRMLGSVLGRMICQRMLWLLVLNDFVAWIRFIGVCFILCMVFRMMGNSVFRNVIKMMLDFLVGMIRMVIGIQVIVGMGCRILIQGRKIFLVILYIFISILIIMSIIIVNR